jgi:hypothetical protein
VIAYLQRVGIDIKAAPAATNNPALGPRASK